MFAEVFIYLKWLTVFKYGWQLQLVKCITQFVRQMVYRLQRGWLISTRLMNVSISKFRYTLYKTYILVAYSHPYII